MQQISTPLRSINTDQSTGASLCTPVDQNRRFIFSFSAPTEKQRRVEGHNSTFVMSNSSGKTKTNSRRFIDNTLGSFLVEDEESVLVASPFSYVTPPMPPREEVSNTKTTRAMAKIVEEKGTPDSVIRKLSFMNQLGVSSSHSSSFDDLPAPGTVNRTGRVSDQEEDSFRFPMVTPSQEMSRVELENDSPTEGFSRFSLSMVELYPPQSPRPLRQGPGGFSEPRSTVPDLLTDCVMCGKQFISSKHLEEHSGYCRPDMRGRMGGNSETSTLAQTTDNTALMLGQAADESLDHHKRRDFLESPALPLYVQRAHAASLPAVAPLPLPPSPSILASPPTELRESNDEDFLEEEISTFLECLRSDVRNDVQKNNRLVNSGSSSLSEGSGGSGVVSITERQREWASRRRFGTEKQQHSLCVSSDEDVSAILGKRGTSNNLVLAPVRSSATIQSSPPPPPQLPPPLPMSSNISVNSPIPQRASYELETSITTSFLAPVVAKYVRARSPTFGLFRASLPSSVSDSAVTLMRLSRLPCSSCGRKFATASRLEKHEAVCQQVFGGDSKRPAFDSSRQRINSTSDEPGITVNGDSGSLVTCKYCSRSFSHVDKLAKHEHVCLSVFKGRKRSKSPTSAHIADSHRRVMSLTSSEVVTVAKKNNLKLVSFTAALVIPSSIKRTNLVSVATQFEETTTFAMSARSRSFTVDSSASSSAALVTSTSSISSVNRTSLEFQYQLLRDQIRSCSEKLKQRRVYACVRDA